MSEKLDMTRESWVCYEGSWGSTKREKVTMRITAWICDERMRGGFECYDIESQGDEYYGEGSLSLGEDGCIDGYDGVGMIDMDIVAWLDTLGMVHPSEDNFFRSELNDAKKGDEE
tara:strand:+ start:328 stop:672 length:345 start_codon:yes stop_codon:yes gene_type:complete